MYAVIPAYKPDKKLYGVIEGLVDAGFDFVIVDDGSGDEYRPLFDSIEADFGTCVTVLRHEMNRGKGRAMKTAFEYVLTHGDEDDGLVTVDADGQHLPADVIKVAAAWRENPESLVLGSRHFTGKVPFKSKWGNGFTRIVFAVTTGVRVFDTQTGLRAFSVKRIPEMLAVRGERYDYEMAQLLDATRDHIDIREVTIETVYLEGNKSSHFRVLKDSFLINKMIFKFILMSFVSFLVDYFTVLASSEILASLPAAVEVAKNKYLMPMFDRMVDTHLVALVLGRLLGSTVNFLLNRNLVFKTGDKLAPVRYFIVVAALVAANYGLITLIVNGNNGMPLWIGQLISQAILYPVSFMLQRKFVFPSRCKRKRS